MEWMRAAANAVLGATEPEPAPEPAEPSPAEPSPASEASPAQSITGGSSAAIAQHSSPQHSSPPRRIPSLLNNADAAAADDATPRTPPGTPPQQRGSRSRRLSATPVRTTPRSAASAADARHDERQLERLRDNDPELTTLWLADGELDEETLETLLAALRTSTNLRRLYLRGKCLSAAAVEELVAVLLDNPRCAVESVTGVDLSACAAYAAAAAAGDTGAENGPSNQAVLSWIAEKRRADRAAALTEGEPEPEPEGDAEEAAPHTAALRRVVRMCLRGDVAPPLLTSAVASLLSAGEGSSDVAALRRVVATHGWIGSRFRRPLGPQQLGQLAADLAACGSSSDAAGDESAVTALLMNEQTRREGQLSWWNTHGKAERTLSGKGNHQYWSDDWLLNRRLARARSRLLLARILDPKAQLPPREPMAFLAGGIKLAEWAASNSWIVEYWCSHLPSEDKLSSADRRILQKLKRRKSTKSVKSIQSLDAGEKEEMEQRLRAANFSQDAAVIQAAVTAARQSGYYGNECPEYMRAMKLLNIIALESDIDSGVGNDGGIVEGSPGPVAECFGQRAACNVSRPCYSPLERARALRAERHSPWLKVFGYEKVKQHPEHTQLEPSDGGGEAIAVTAGMLATSPVLARGDAESAPWAEQPNGSPSLTAADRKLLRPLGRKLQFDR